MAAARGNLGNPGEPAEHPSSRAGEPGEPWGNLGGTSGEPWGNLGQAFLKDFLRKAWGNHAAEQPSSRPGEPGGPWGNLGGTSGEPWGNLGQPFPKDFLRKAWGNLGGTLSRLRAAEQPSSRAGEPGGARLEHRPRASKNTLGPAYW